MEGPIEINAKKIAVLEVKIQRTQKAIWGLADVALKLIELLPKNNTYLRLKISVENILEEYKNETSD